MGSDNINFKDFGGGETSYSGIMGDLRLTRQPSVYSLTFDEFHSAIGGSVKDFGSMNMDELLKNIWTEENKFTASASVGRPDPWVHLPRQVPRQGSLTLPRTLSQKTVDAVWKDISKEFFPGKDAGDVSATPVMPYRQPTLGEVTLEEFLVKAGVVREDAVFGNKLSNGNLIGDLGHVDNSMGLGVQQLEQGMNLMATRNLDGEGNLIPIQPSSTPQNWTGIQPNQPQHPSLVRPLPQILPKNPVKSPYNGLVNGQGITGGLPDEVVRSNLAQTGALQNKGIAMVAPILGSSNSPTNPVSPDGMARSNRDFSSLSPAPYVFNGGLRGRRCTASVEKIVERRQRRMIKNRESAARSRARKQAYTMELEAEIAKLKEQNHELQKKQAEIIEKQRNQAAEMMNVQCGFKRRCLRRTRTEAW
ncbi:hypothetical protein MLD38_002067 [Melastoma candidum]|uniref:Uncharacterized protein n=1 Tax=Melastoma candidum TaxID=119954 RepID=A0ACB9SGJ8_9MYRT|nr:hypothetical protein MLD38_002067 [Melastoma candidum]